MQAWFSGGSSEGEGLGKEGSSLLADWNSYAASRESDEGGAFGFDLESAMRSDNDTLTGTFNVVSKGVKDIPGNFQSATSSVPSGKARLFWFIFWRVGSFSISCHRNLQFALLLDVALSLDHSLLLEAQRSS